MITVYYGNIANQLVYEPEPLFQSFYKNIDVKDEDDDYLVLKKCPALKNFCKNIFVLKNQINYNVQYHKNGSLSTTYNDHNFFNSFVVERNKTGFFSFLHPKYFFYSDKSLEMEVTGPYLHNCDVNRKTVVIPGKYNIGKHFRSVECAMQFHQPDYLMFNESEPSLYVRFLTDEKIVFKKFFFSLDLIHITDSVLKLRDHDMKSKPKLMSYWYDLHEKVYRKRILKLIKENLV